MLPDYPATKEKIFDKVILRRYDAIRELYLGKLAEIPVVRQYEGAQHDDGSGPRPYHEATSKFEITVRDLEEINADELIARIDVFLTDMIRQQHEFMFARFKEMQESGSVIVTGGTEPLTIETFLQAVEQQLIEFDEQGNPCVPGVFVASLDLSMSFYAAGQALLTTPDSIARFDAIMQKKRMQWRDRESSRKLVG